MKRPYELMELRDQSQQSVRLFFRLDPWCHYQCNVRKANALRNDSIIVIANIKRGAFASPRLVGAAVIVCVSNSHCMFTADTTRQLYEAHTLYGIQTWMKDPMLINLFCLFL